VSCETPRRHKRDTDTTSDRCVYACASHGVMPHLAAKGAVRAVQGAWLVGRLNLRCDGVCVCVCDVTHTHIVCVSAPTRAQQ
jgi:hypothetical protein